MATVMRKSNLPFIPNEPIEPVADTKKISMLLYGPSKVGKSAFAAMFPDHFIVGCCSKNLDHIKARYCYVKTWEQLLAVLDEIDEGRINCETLIIDEMDKIEFMCVQYIRTTLLKLAPEQKSNYDVWDKRTTFLIQLMRALKELENKALICTFNDTSLEDGRRVLSGAPNGLRVITDGEFIVRSYMEADMKGIRWLNIEPTARLEVGNGYSNHFLWEGKRLKRFSLGTSPEEAYMSFQAAFNNAKEGETL